MGFNIRMEIPEIITVNGRGDTVSLSYEENKNMKARIELLEVLAEAEDDAGIRKIILYVAQNFGNTVALEKLDKIEECILGLGDNPYIGIVPRYPVLRRQGYKVLALEKDLIETLQEYPIRQVFQLLLNNYPVRVGWG